MARPLPPFDPAFALAAACTLLEDAHLRETAPKLLAQRRFDWVRLAEVAFFNQVEQVVLQRLEHAAPGAIPAQLEARIRHAAIRTSALQAAQAKLSGEMTRVLADAGIPSVTIKGLALAKLLYDPAPEQRPSNDVDIVIAPENLRRADRVLRAHGLLRTWPEREPPEAAWPMLLRFANVFDYRGPALNELVELHCRPTVNPYWMPVTFADLQAASVEVNLGEATVQALDGPLNVHYLAQHAIYYFIFRLKWFGDLARAVRREGAGNCAARIARYPKPLPGHPGQLADEILCTLEMGIECAAGASDAFARANAAAANIVRHMTDSVPIRRGRSLASLPTEFWNHALILRHLPGWRGKLRQVLLALSDPRDAATLRLSPNFTPVYWLAGPMLSLARYLRRQLPQPKALRRNTETTA